MVRLEGVAAVKSFYARLFRADTCLGIFSHVPQTLEQLSRFFADTQIDAKLRVSPIGISERTLHVLLAQPRAPGRPPTFLFSSSFHDDPINFTRCGGHIALMFAERFLRSGREGRFVFHSRRPPRAELVKSGADAGFLDAVAGRQLRWIEEYLPEREQLRLFGLADFVLLPSLNLHSVTIMRALAAGAVPVVSDIVGTDQYIEDGVTGIVLRGIREAAWHEDPETGIPVHAQPIPIGLAAELANKIHQRILEVLDGPGRFADLRAAGRHAAKARFSGARFRESLSESVMRILKSGSGVVEHSDATHRDSVLAASGALVTGSWERYFASPSQPTVMVDVGRAKVYGFRGVYYFVPEELDADLSAFDLNAFTLKSRGELRRFRVRLASSLNELIEPLYFALYESRPLFRRLRYIRSRTTNQIKAYLWPYKRAYRLARSAYRLAQVALRAAGRPFSGRH
jgi:hypothetical protein